MSKKINLTLYLLIAVVSFNLIGCATQPSISQPLPKFMTGGIYHKVLAGETLWRISQTYDVDLDTIVSINRIPNATKIERGQLIFIPGATSSRSTEAQKLYSVESNFIWPADGKIITYFGERFNDRLNKGLDIQIKSKKEVLASRSGKVSFADFLKGYGKTIIIEHPDGYSTVYAYNSQIFVKPKEIVKQGASIGRCEEAHLHFEIRKGSKPQNPLYYLP